MKQSLSSPPTLAYFDPSLPTMLQTDASRLKRPRYALLQQHGENWRLFQCGSRFFSEVETRYATQARIKGEPWGYSPRAPTKKGASTKYRPPSFNLVYSNYIIKNTKEFCRLASQKYLKISRWAPMIPIRHTWYSVSNLKWTPGACITYFQNYRVVEPIVRQPATTILVVLILTSAGPTRQEQH